MKTLAVPRSAKDTTGALNTEPYRRNDRVDQRSRPMVVGVSYLGRKSEEKANEHDLTTEKMYQMTAAEIRELCHVYDLDGMTQEFHEGGITSPQALEESMKLRGMSEELRLQIKAVVEKGDFAPKFERLEGNQLIVTVSYADRSTRNQAREIPGSTTVSTSSSMRGFGDLRR